LETYTFKDDVAKGFVHQYSNGQLLKNAVVVNCFNDRGGQMVWGYPSGRKDVLFWSAKGTRVYDGIGAIMCAGRATEEKTQPAKGEHKW
jgi:hypothetical protein